jgi:hypothetical protein
VDANASLPAGARSGAYGNASREALVHALYEAAELEHNLMCTYLYAAVSLKSAAGIPCAGANSPLR